VPVAGSGLNMLASAHFLRNQWSPILGAMGMSAALHMAGVIWSMHHQAHHFSQPGTSLSIFSARLQVAQRPSRLQPFAAPNPPQGLTQPTVPKAIPAQAREAKPSPVTTLAASNSQPASAPTISDLPDQIPLAPEPSAPQASQPQILSPFAPLTSQALGRGGWGRRSRRDFNSEAMAQQENAAAALRASVYQRLTSMAEVIRQSQQAAEFQCRIQLDPINLRGQLSCNPASLEGQASSALQGVLDLGDQPTITEKLCVTWGAFEVLFVPCELMDQGGDPVEAP
jgi:hypothetical protein